MAGESAPPVQSWSHQTHIPPSAARAARSRPNGWQSLRAPIRPHSNQKAASVHPRTIVAVGRADRDGKRRGTRRQSRRRILDLAVIRLFHCHVAPRVNDRHGIRRSAHSAVHLTYAAISPPHPPPLLYCHRDRQPTPERCMTMYPSFLCSGALSIPHTSRSSVYSSYATGRPCLPSSPRTCGRRAALLRCAAATPSPTSPPLSCGAARHALLSAIRGTERGTRSPADTTAAVLAAIDAMVTACGGGEDASDGGPVTPAPGMEWVDRLAGRWRLLFSTESGLTALMGGGVPLVSAADVYQLVEGEGVLKVRHAHVVLEAGGWEGGRPASSPFGLVAHACWDLAHAAICGFIVHSPTGRLL